LQPLARPVLWVEMGRLRFNWHTLVAATALGVLAGGACGGSKSTTPSSSVIGAESGWTFVPPGADPAGSLPSGGTAAGASGSGTGGAAGAGGKRNVAGSGGAAAITPKPYACGGIVPDQAVITHFDGFMKDRWTSPGNLEGGVYIYPDPLLLKDGDFLRFQDQVTTWTGIGVWFAGCINASRFAGVKFTIYGAVPPGRQVWVYAISNRNRDIDDDNSVGACAPADPQDAWATCHPPGLVLPVTSEPTTSYLPWSAFTDGAPSALTDGSDLLALQWSFDWNDTLVPYAAELTVDDLEFVLPGSEPGGGSGGAGGTSAAGGGGSGGTPAAQDGGAGGI
jgi:hypothetical protein